jgi:hypothetical protein
VKSGTVQGTLRRKYQTLAQPQPGLLPDQSTQFGSDQPGQTRGTVRGLSDGRLLGVIGCAFCYLREEVYPDRIQR